MREGNLFSTFNFAFGIWPFLAENYFEKDLITKIGSGATFNSQVETVKKFVNALGISIDDLMKEQYIFINLSCSYIILKICVYL